jgi:hypothetical protein
VKLLREHIPAALITLPVYWVGWQLLDAAWAAVR